VPTASYYKDQARIFALWAMAATDPAVAQYLRTRAEDYLALSEKLAPGAVLDELPQAARQQQQQSAPDDS
jgi:hypothetical protein